MGVPFPHAGFSSRAPVTGCSACLPECVPVFKDVYFPDMMPPQSQSLDSPGVQLQGKAQYSSIASRNTGSIGHGKMPRGCQAHSSLLEFQGLLQQSGSKSTSDISDRISYWGLGCKIVKQDGGVHGEMESPSDGHLRGSHCGLVCPGSSTALPLPATQP